MLETIARNLNIAFTLNVKEHVSVDSQTSKSKEHMRTLGPANEVLVLGIIIISRESIIVPV